MKPGYLARLRTRLRREQKAKKPPMRNKVIISYDTVKAYSRNDTAETYPFNKSGYGSRRIHTAVGDRVACFIEARTICPSTDSDEAFQLVQDWLNACTRTHSTCRTLANAELPLRLLDVGSWQETAREPFLSTKHPDLGRYACLSYCWGGPQTTKTTLSTLEAKKSSIPLQELPKTIQDAVIITRRLGIQYLWVDSLCIIQDSPEDWDSQAALMGEIYANAFITIAAAASANCHGGCFAARTLSSDAPFKLNVRGRDGGIGTVYIGNDTELVDFGAERGRSEISPYSWMDQKTALDERGWTLQESLLSTRILKYTPNLMFWTCRAASLREDGAAYLYTHSENDEFRHFVEHLHSQVKRKSDILTEASAYGSAGNNSGVGPDSLDVLQRLEELNDQILYAWYLLVEEYCRRQLTFKSDRLPAMGGVAAKMAAATQDEYIHGIWRSDLVRGLAWERKSPIDAWNDSQPTNMSQSGNGTSLSQTRDAPSWSWAAADGPVNTNMAHYWDSGGSPYGPEPVVRIVPMPTGIADAITSASSPVNIYPDMLLTVEGFVREADEREIAIVTSQPYDNRRYPDRRYDAERYKFDQHPSIITAVVRDGKRMLGLYLQTNLELLVVPVIGLEGVYRRIGLRDPSSWWGGEQKSYDKKIITLC
ncbi:heterokaryon incompatibility protein-domain-containing protein [Xylogone sp. PMI_703]|nr:heterokaryon incompatibility protein-domain-containing protein [Xylogone sp. PMI_703]